MTLTDILKLVDAASSAFAAALGSPRRPATPSPAPISRLSMST